MEATYLYVHQQMNGKEDVVPHTHTHTHTQWYMYTYILSQKKNEIMSFAAPWTDVDIIILT